MGEIQLFHSLSDRKDIVMSAFLGPIHYWLYNKIQLQEELIRSFLETAAQEGWNTVSGEKLDAACGKADLRPLEDIIDQGNIHGWLHQRIGASEIRLAFLVTELLKEDPSRITKLKQVAYRFGENHSLEDGVGADDALTFLEGTLLDGMPCDHVNRIIEHGEDRVAWQQTQCVHHEYWERVGGDISAYYALRAQIIEGILAHSNLSFCAAGNGEFEIRKGRGQADSARYADRACSN